MQTMKAPGNESHNDRPPPAAVYSVSQLNNEARAILASAFPLLRVEGELSNLRRLSSGHWYFSLKDQAAQVSCAMFRQHNRLLRDIPKDGDQIQVRARVDLYQARGQYQLIVEHIQAAGAGALRARFEQIKQTLAAEGLFDTTLKRPLPKLPRRIGIITSAEGAALRDILSVLKRRFKAIPVQVIGVRVQGQQAVQQICDALATIDQQTSPPELIILARGGGSLEDLWAFNDEQLARHIAACPIPLITGIGHEIDFTIADFVADQRAPTPSAAAELAVPDSQQWLDNIQQQRQRLLDSWQRQQQQLSNRYQNLLQRLRLQHPKQRLDPHKQRLDELQQRLQRQAQQLIQRQRQHLNQARHQLDKHNPQQRLARYRVQLTALQQGLRHSPWITRLNEHNQRITNQQQRLTQAMRQTLAQRKQSLALEAKQLHSVSPLAVLERGYAIALNPTNGRLIKTVQDTKPGETIQLKLHDGEMECRIENVRQTRQQPQASTPPKARK